MSVVIYWQERLQARHPLFCPSHRVLGFNIKARPGEDIWPAAVARSALFEDYLVWHEERLLASYRTTPMYADHPELMPKPVDELGFYNTMAPMLYVIGKEQQVRNYKVMVNRHFNGKWQTGSQRRYFVRLAEWSEHCAAFEIQTGLDVHADLVYFDIVKAKVLSDAQNGWREDTADNRKRMEKAMGRDPT